ncbi:SRPBCC domain-containing protein [Myxococcota bacterium]|nr:SRPBCC domain-containing protein [Myxococcota bacterium]
MKYRLSRYRVRGDAIQNATDAIHTFTEAISQLEPGTLRYDAFIEKDGRSFLHVMAFETSEAEDHHRKSTEVSQFLATLEPLCEETPKNVELVAVATVGAPDLRARNIHHYFRFPAPPDRIFQVLTDAKLHAEVTGQAATIDASVGGRFSVCGDKVQGWTLESVPNRRLVQAWRHKDWPEGTWSTATIALSKHEDQTDLHFMQTGVPSEHYAWVDALWKGTYWAALDRFLRR